VVAPPEPDSIHLMIRSPQDRFFAFCVAFGFTSSMYTFDVLLQLKKQIAMIATDNKVI
jgi:hypothetical protein